MSLGAGIIQPECDTPICHVSDVHVFFTVARLHYASLLWVVYNVELHARRQLGTLQLCTLYLE